MLGLQKIRLALEDNIVLESGVKIWTVNHRFDDTEAAISDQGFSEDAVVIGRGCWLGANVFVMPGVLLPRDCVVSACTVLSKKKYPPGAIIAGYPARAIGRRNGYT